MTTESKLMLFRNFSALFLLNLALLACFALVGCGSHHDTGSAPQSTQSVSGAVSGDAGTNQPAIQAQEGARLVNTSADMATCDATNFRELIYVIEETQFYFCAEDNSWQPIDLKGSSGETGSVGRDGRDGTQGIQGVAGKDGSNGQVGRDGRDGRDGKNAPSLADNEWLSPITGEKWILGKRLHPYDVLNDGLTLCAQGSHSPTSDEIVAAASAGMLTKFKDYFSNSEVIANTYSDSQGLIITTINSGSFAVSENRLPTGSYPAWWIAPSYVTCIIGN